MAYARIVDNTARDVRPDSPEGFFTAEVAAQFVQVPDSVKEGSIKSGSKWLPPEPLPVPSLAPSLDSLKAELHARVVERHAKESARGVAYVFPDGLKDVIQTRTVVDTTNVTGMVVAAQILQEKGETRPVLGFRGESNVTHPLTPAQMIDLGMAVQGATVATYAAKWAHDTAIDALKSVEEAQAYNLDTGWPE